MSEYVYTSQQRKPERRQRVDWIKYTDFRSRHSASDLRKLCAGWSRDELRLMWSTRDDGGLSPVHWAAINNRSDMLEFMADSGAQLDAKCTNKLLADGSPLHLAALNGAIEAADVLLRRMSSRKSSQNANSSSPETLDNNNNNAVLKALETTDRDGQTAVMRCAAPRSRRLDTVRDLLRKNLWSLNARPAEMALFLISRGADWRKQEPRTKMNLLHLAIVNDCDDLVHLLLVLDRQHLLSTRVPVENNVRRFERTSRRSARRGTKTEPLLAIDTDSGIVTTSSNVDNSGNIDSSRPSSAASSNDSHASSASNNSSNPLLNSSRVSKSKSSAKTKTSVPDTVTPLELAMVYGRVGVISLLWRAEHEASFDNQQELEANAKQLNAVLWRVFWSDPGEVRLFARQAALKALLAVDLIIFGLVWLPQCVDSDAWLASSVFLSAICLTLTFACRVMLRNPGFLRRDSATYVAELSALVSNNPNFDKQNKLAKQDQSTPNKDQQQKQQTKKDNNNSNHQKEHTTTNQDTPTSRLDTDQRVRLLCHKCKCVRRPRTRHCNYCQHCVLDFDHHCVYLGACIGRWNRLDLLIVLLLTCVTATIGVVQLARPAPNYYRSRLVRWLGLLWLAKYVFIGALSTFCVLRRLLAGVTMYEEIRARRLRTIFGNVSAPPSTHKAAFSDSFWRTLPKGSPGDDDGFPVRPHELLGKLREFANFGSLSEYLLLGLCADSPLAAASLSRNAPAANTSRVDINARLV